MHALIVDGLPPSVTDRDLKEFFNSYLAHYFEQHPEYHIGNVDIPRDPRSGELFGYAYVRFCSEAAAVEAQILTNGARLFSDGVPSVLTIRQI